MMYFGSLESAFLTTWPPHCSCFFVEQGVNSRPFCHVHYLCVTVSGILFCYLVCARTRVGKLIFFVFVDRWSMSLSCRVGWWLHSPLDLEFGCSAHTFAVRHWVLTACSVACVNKNSVCYRSIRVKLINV